MFSAMSLLETLLFLSKIRKHVLWLEVDSVLRHPLHRGRHQPCERPPKCSSNVASSVWGLKGKNIDMMVFTWSPPNTGTNELQNPPYTCWQTNSDIVIIWPN